MTDISYDCDVLVVGLGPVGAVMAALLGDLGHSVLAIEPQHEVYPLPRAAHVDHEVMRIFQALGVIDAVLPHMRVAPDYEFLASNGKPLIHFQRDGLNGTGGWPVSYNVYQPGIERAVRTRLDALDDVTVELGSRFDALVEHDDAGVVVRIDGEHGPRTVRARYLAACDGARSPVREALGIGLDDLDFDEPWLVLDAWVPDESGFPESNIQFCDPERPTSFVHMGPNRLRWEFMLRADEDPQAMLHPENLETLLKPWRAKGELNVERTAVYQFHGLIADQWRKGSVLLVGDSAHQTPPFLGQGLCSGLRDAVNLAWKLDAVLDGADQALLDSYMREREPHCRFLITKAIEMGRVVCTFDRERAAARDAEMLANPLVSGPFILPALVGALRHGDAMAGLPFPQATDPSEGRLDDVLGAGAWLLHTGQSGAVAATPGLRVVDVRRDLPPALGAAVAETIAATGGEAVLVRPDRYVFGSGNAADLVRAWADLVGAAKVPA